MKLSDKYKADFHRQTSACILCHAPAAYGSAFTPHPDQAHLFGGIPGKQRVIFFGLCKQCACKPDALQRAEGIMMAHFAGMLQESWVQHGDKMVKHTWVRGSQPA